MLRYFSRSRPYLTAIFQGYSLCIFFFLFLPFVTKFSRTKHRELQPRNKRHQACRNERRQTSRPPGVAISSNAIRLRIDKTKPSLCSMCWIRGVENSRYSSYILQIFHKYSGDIPNVPSIPNIPRYSRIFADILGYSRMFLDILR